MENILQPYEKKHIEMLRSCLPECTVLLKQKGDFPLASAGKIALYGSGVRRTIKGGTGSGEVNSRYYDTVEAGFEKAGFTVTTKSWLDAYDKVVEKAQQAFNRQLRLRAKEQHTHVMLLAMGAVVPEPEYELPLQAEGDTALYVLSRISGEGTDRKPEKGDICLTASERRDILELSKRFPHFMLVLNVGGVVDLSPVMEVPNILLLSQLGVETGSTLARIVLGQQYPSGKLTTTWAPWEQYEGLDYGGYDDTRYKEGVYVGYRYFDTVHKPVLFPFGYGLGYTTFALTNSAVKAEKTGIFVSVTVKNTGARPGKEVVQVYVSVPGGVLDQPYQMLAVWVKTPELAPGQSETVQASFALPELAGYDGARAAYILEKGDYILRVGTQSRNTVPVAVVRLDADVTVRQVRNALGTPDFVDFKPDPMPAAATGDLPVLKVDAAAFAPRTVDYTPEYPIDEAVQSLSEEELALLSNGHFGKGGVLSMIGNASSTVCGAAGETAHVDGFPVIVMADGPAGIRIHQRYFEDARGIHSMEPPFPQSMVPFMPAGLQFVMNHFVIKKPKSPDQIRYQYCTALPIGTALAQSWNLSVAEVCGDIVGNEMERFHIDLWLAPALNIHRSIQCGRNFEYFSEDPLISGKFAAAIARGVQKHPGKGVTIKHYAANNQEFNRTSSNSMVSERAMREIYLKGFEIAVREGCPAAVMTSYNLLNGQHTSTRRDLIEDVLRCEFGFRGIVMTDWVVQGGMIPKDAKYPGPAAADVAAAGGDLFMPGSKADVSNVLNAVKEGRLSKEQLRMNATRVLAFGRNTVHKGQTECAEE